MKVKGMAFNARVEFVEERFGADGLRDVFEIVPSVKALYEAGGGFFPSMLYPYAEYTAFNDAIREKLYGGRERAYHDMGEASAQAALSTVHKVFVMNRDVRSFLRSLNVIYNAYFTGLGSGGAEISEKENFARAVIKDVPSPHRSLCQIVFHYMKHGVEMCGAGSVFMSEKTCLCRGGGECSAELRWTI